MNEPLTSQQTAGQSEAESKDAEDALRFAKAFKKMHKLGHITFNMLNFAGWHDDCNCEMCEGLQVIYDYVFPKTAESEAKAEAFWAKQSYTESEAVASG